VPSSRKQDKEISGFVKKINFLASYDTISFSKLLCSTELADQLLFLPPVFAPFTYLFRVLTKTIFHTSIFCRVTQTSAQDGINEATVLVSNNIPRVYHLSVKRIPCAVHTAMLLQSRSDCRK
jgi:hypothetical protein